ncbi:hypothetical protein HBIAX_05416 [Achromobacter xylosoxidans]|nr:hypothetical protein HBIAX_05416 [Achromobacter xylosoxidans]
MGQIGIVTELRVSAVLTTSVSPHARRAVREAQELPKGISSDLATVHTRRPFPYSADEIDDFAQAVRDPNFRVQAAADGVHVYNRDGHWTASDPFELYPRLKLDTDGGHAFYMGVQLARALLH